jgi:hypothetical protein
MVAAERGTVVVIAWGARRWYEKMDFPCGSTCAHERRGDRPLRPVPLSSCVPSRFGSRMRCHRRRRRGGHTPPATSRSLPVAGPRGEPFGTGEARGERPPHGGQAGWPWGAQRSTGVLWAHRRDGIGEAPSTVPRGQHGTGDMHGVREGRARAASGDA